MPLCCSYLFAVRVLLLEVVPHKQLTQAQKLAVYGAGEVERKFCNP